MPTTTAIDPDEFQRLLSRNLKLPLLGGLLGAVVFVALIFYLLSVIGWVEHSDRITRSAAEVQRRSIDMETGMRGFLITGDDSFLEPYERALQRIGNDLGALRMLVTDNPAQVARVERIATLQTAWNEFAREMIALRRAGGDYQQSVRLGRGKRLSDEMRTEYDALVNAEQALRAERAPVGVAHVLHDVLQHLAATLVGHVHVVGLLLRAVVAQAEVQHVPRQRGVREEVHALFRRGGAKADDAVLDADAGAARIVVAVVVAGVGHELGQHVRGRDVEQAARERALHQLEPVVEVVLERPGGGLEEGDGRGHRLLVVVHA